MCSNCGLTQPGWRRSQYFDLLALVGFLFSNDWVDDEEVCVRCAPHWRTYFGFTLYALFFLGLLFAIWIWGVRWGLLN